MNTATDPARPRGILNERERRYLLGQTEIVPKSQAERDVRATIRERLTHAVYDLALLFEHLEDRDLEQVFDPRADDVAQLRTAIEDTVGFLYRATIDFHPPFPYLAREGIQRAEQTHFDRYVKATIDVEPTAPIDPAVIRQKMKGERTGRLTPDEAMWIAETIIEADQFSFADLDEAHERVREHQAGLDTEAGETGDRDRD